jgi:WD40 repeat protein
MRNLKVKRVRINIFSRLNMGPCYTQYILKSQAITITAFSILILLGFSNKRTALYIGTSKQFKTSTAWTASWSYDDKFVAIGDYKGELTIYETTEWKKVKSWDFAATITRAEWNPKYPILAIAAFSHQHDPSIIQLYDVEKNQVIKYLPDTLFGRGVSWSPNGEEVAFVGARGRISLYTKTGKHQKTLSFTHNSSLFDIDWHPSKNILLAVEEDIYLIDIDRDRLLATYDDGTKGKGILCCSWHPSGAVFVTGDYGHENEGGEPSYLKYWSNTGTLLNTIREGRSEYRNVKWTEDGKYLAAATDVLLVLDEKGQTVSKTKFDGNNLWGIAWNNKGDKIITSDGAGNVRVTNSQGTILKAFTQ